MSFIWFTHLHFQLYDAVFEWNECYVTAILLHCRSNPRIKQFFDHHHCFVVIFVDFYWNKGIKRICFFGKIYALQSMTARKMNNFDKSLPVSAFGFFSFTTGKPLAKKSIIMAKISGFKRPQSASSCFDTVIKSLPKNTPRTPSMRKSNFAGIRIQNQTNYFEKKRDSEKRSSRLSHTHLMD